MSSPLAIDNGETQVEKLEQRETRKETSTFLEVYPIQEPYVYAAIFKDPVTQRIEYQIIEPTLTEKEPQILAEIKDKLIEEIDINLKEITTKIKAEAYLTQKIREIISDFHFQIAPEAADKFIFKKHQLYCQHLLPLWGEPISAHRHRRDPFDVDNYASWPHPRRCTHLGP